MKPTAHYLVVAGTVSLGLVGLAVASHDPAGFDRLFGEPLLLSVWIGLAALAALSVLPLPGGRGSVSPAPALELGGLLVFGPAAAAWLVVFSRLVSNTRLRWTPLPRSLFHFGEGVLSVAVAGSVFEAFGGRWGAGFASDPSQSLPILLAGAAYVGLQIAAGVAGRWYSHGDSISGRDSWILRALRASALSMGGGFIALIVVRMGWEGAVLLALPLTLIAYAGRLRERSELGHLETVRSLMTAVDAADPFTRGHSYRISKMCVRLARHLGLGEAETRELEYAALLHDIGRTTIQHELWGKAGTLSREEQSAVRNHPRIGAGWIERAGFFTGAADVVLLHHEQPDGKGYPHGVRGDAIPLGSRIIMVVAAFDAMTSDRPYRQGLSPEEAFEELLTHSGTQFYSEIVEALIELYSKGRLYEDFDEDVLEYYREGVWSSRALERYLSRSAPVPAKRGPVSGSDDGDVPVIDFPGPAEGPAAMEKDQDLAIGDSLRLRVAFRSDVGCVRKNNEDSVATIVGTRPEDGALLVLADGMGGAAAGEVASRMAVDSLRSSYFEALREGGPADALRRSMESANTAIHARAAADPDLKGMGTTCTAAAITGRALHVGHVGDSRAYILEDGDIRMLTRDHTLAAELAGIGGGRGAAPEGAKNVLTRCLGNQPEVQVEVFERPVELAPGTVLVLCSDGLSNLVSPDEILAIAEDQDPKASCSELVELARERGGPDNITVQVARVMAA